MIAVWRAAVRAGSLPRALGRFSAGPRECARKFSRAIKIPLMRHATLIVLRHVFLSQHFSCSNFCRARPLLAHKRAHIRMSAPSRRSRRTSKLKRKGQRKCASCADSRKPRTTLTERIETKPPVRHRPPRRTRPRATANPPPTTQLTQRQPRKATAFAFLPPGKPPEACIATSAWAQSARAGRKTNFIRNRPISKSKYGIEIGASALITLRRFVVARASSKANFKIFCI